MCKSAVGGGAVCKLEMGGEGEGRLAAVEKSELHTPLISSCNLSTGEWQRKAPRCRTGTNSITES